MGTDLTTTSENGHHGPAMKRLRPMQQAFVEAMLLTGGASNTKAARMAGYAGNSDTLRATAYRLAHDPDIKEAIREEAGNRVHSGAILGASVLLEIANDPTHKDRFKAASALLDRSGLVVEHKQTVVVQHTMEDNEKIKRIVEMSKRLGLDARQLLGEAGVGSDIIDAEFAPVAAEEDWSID